MSEYQYKVFDRKGEIHFGRFVAANYKEAEKKLKDQEWIIVSLAPVFSKLSIDNFFSKLSSDQELFFYIQFSSLLSAEVPLLKALEIVSGQIKNDEFRIALEESQREIKNGTSLSESFRKHEKFFNTLTLGMIEAGEESGKLDTIFLQLSKIGEQKHQFRQDVVSAVSYPFLLFLVSVFLSSVIMIFVYPRFLEIFSENNIELPFATIVLAKIAFFLRDFYHIILAVLAVFLLAFIKYAKSPQGDITVERFIFRVPVIGEILKMLFLQRLFFNMALLLKSGIPLLQTIELLAKTITNTSMTRILADIWVTLCHGGSMSDAIKSHEELPSLVHQIIVVGEQTGKMEDLLEKVADYYHITVTTRLRRLNMIIEPVLLLVLGIFVAFLMASLLLPMFKAFRTLK